jgi:uncharacterized protein YjiS (DUF1127 family)
MMSLGIIVDRLRACWSNLQAVFTEWRHRIRVRYDLERLNERGLADMRMTRTDAFNETQKPFWEPRVRTKTDLKQRSSKLPMLMR